VTPFADLRVKAAPALPPAPAAPRPGPAQPVAPGTALDPEDRQLLDAFRGAGAIEFGAQGREEVRLSLTRRSGGRPVTIVHGLRGLSVLDLMEMTAELRRQFGMVARFRDTAVP
jgi:translation initiation factor 1 (eIF-1/SUI1)